MTKKTALSPQRVPGERPEDIESLRAAEVRYRMLFDATPNALFLVGPDGRFLDANQTALDWYGYSLTEFKRMTPADLAASTVLKNRALEKVRLAEQIPTRFEWRHRCKDGRELDVEIHTIPVKIGTEACNYAIVQDVTERRQVAEALNKSEEMYRRLVETAKEGIWMMDGGYLTTFVNQSMAEMLGFTPQEMIGRPVYDFMFVEDLEDHSDKMKKRRCGEDQVYERRFCCKDGSELWTLVSATALQDEQGNFAGSFAMFTDITERKHAEKALQASEERYRLIAQYIDDVFWQLGTDLKFTYVSPAVEKMLGYSPEAHLYVTDLLDQDGIARMQEVIQTKLAGVVSATPTEYRMKHLDGHWVDVEVLSSPVFDKDGKPAGFVGVTRDISIRKHAEEAIRRAERRASALIEHAPDGIVFVSPDGRFIFASPSARKLFGYEGEELNELSPNELTHPEDLPMVLETLMTLLQDPVRVFTLQYRFRHKDGRWLWIESTFSNLIAEPSVAAIVINFRVITARKQAEEALAKTKQYWQSLVERTSDLVTIVDHTGLIRYQNPASERILGYQPEELTGKPVADFVQADDLAHGWDAFVASMPPSANNTPVVELRIRHKDGSWRTMEVTGEVKADEDGQNVAVLTSRDITERKLVEAEARNYSERLEQEVSARARELQEAQEKLLRQEKLAVLGQLAGGVGHELRNPLSVITNAIYLLRLVQPDAGPKVQEYLGIIEQETHTAEKIISDLLEFSRTKSVDREPVRVDDLLQMVLQRFSPPETITVKTEFSQDALQVFADPRHMQQVFGNLVVNACQAMPQGGTLTLSTQKIGQEIAVSVQDTGVGISPENMKKLFEPLFTTKAKGIGLGLAVSRKLVEANGGRFEVRSEAGKGSIFTVYLSKEQEAS